MDSSEGREFQTTHWSMVVAAANENHPAHQSALEALCSKYWSPLYCFVRSKGCSQADAQDRVQGFFVHLLEKGTVRSADAERGRFRNFLLASFDNFLRNQTVKQHAVKRGGRHRRIDLDFASAEKAWLRCQNTQAPEKVYLRQWAVSLLDQVLLQLRSNYKASGKEDLFEALVPYLIQESNLVPYQMVADKLGVSVATIKTSVHRLRQRYRETLCREIEETVSDPASVDDEIRALFEAVAPGC